MRTISELERKAANPGKPYWIPEDPEAALYCSDCIDIVADTSQPYGETWDGGFDCEEDSAVRCARCGVVVDYTLTDYGVESELEHFWEYGFDQTSPDQCFEMLRVYYALWTDEQKVRFWTIINRNPLNELMAMVF